MLKTLVLLVLSFSISAQEYTPVHPELVGTELLDKLVQDYKPTGELFYGPARDTLFSRIDSKDDSLTCVYTGYTIYLDPLLDPTQAAYMNGSSNGINTEHTYPQSFGAGDGNARSDMHHLFPTWNTANTVRGNKPFRDIDDINTDSWLYENMQQSNIPTASVIALYSESNSQFFEPREDHKGDVARAIFYFYTMYAQEANTADPSYFDSQTTTLCDWHLQDPVSSKEWTRTHGIGEYQEGKPNPFILDCTLATRTYCEQQLCITTSTDDVVQEQVLVYPNPTSDELHISNLLTDSKLYLFDLNGVLFGTYKKQNNTSVIDVRDLPNGLYYLRIVSATCSLTVPLLINR